MLRPRTAFVLILTLGAVAASTAVAPHAAASDRMPDLAMAPLKDIRVETTSDGHRLLRFTTTIVNIGSGPFEVRGTRGSESESEMSTVQRVYDSSTGFRDIATAATMFFAGDGHNHWHVRDLESSELVGLDNGSKAGAGAKRGFCFTDNTRYQLSLPGAPQSPVYTSCGSSSSTAVTMGLSVGWGDVYPYYLAYQYIDITGVNPGRYRLTTVADSENWFVESNDSNNGTAEDLQITGNSALSFTAYPASTTIKFGTRRAGNVSRLAADDGSFFQINSSSGTTFWYGVFPGVPNNLVDLRTYYSGMASKTVNQRIRIWNFRTGSWNTVDTRSVGLSKIAITARPGGTLADYVSGAKGNGDIRVGVRCRRSDSTRFVCSADILNITFDV